MAPRTKASANSAEAPTPAAYDPERYYSVQLAQGVEYPAGSGSYLSPANRIEMNGSVAEALKDAIEDARAL